jgi:hypothetical protein
MTGQNLIDGLMIEIGTVVAFEHERRSMPQEPLLQANEPAQECRSSRRAIAKRFAMLSAGGAPAAVGKPAVPGPLP